MTITNFHAVSQSASRTTVEFIPEVHGNIVLTKTLPNVSYLIRKCFFPLMNFTMFNQLIVFSKRRQIQTDVYDQINIGACWLISGGCGNS